MSSSSSMPATGRDEDNNDLLTHSRTTTTTTTTTTTIRPFGSNHEHRVLIALAVCFFGLSSIIASCIIIYMAQRKRNRPYHAIVMGLSFADIMVTFSYMLQSFATPSTTSDFSWSFGTTATCSMVGFLYTTSTLWTSFFNCVLSFYFVLTVRYGWKLRHVTIYYQRPVTIVIIIVPLLLGLYGLLTNSFNPYPTALVCHIRDYTILTPECKKDGIHNVDNSPSSSPPEHCIEEIRGQNHAVILLSTTSSLYMIASCASFLGTAVVFQTVRNRFQKSSRYEFEQQRISLLEDSTASKPTNNNYNNNTINDTTNKSDGAVSSIVVANSNNNNNNNNIQQANKGQKQGPPSSGDEETEEDTNNKYDLRLDNNSNHTGNSTSNILTESIDLIRNSLGSINNNDTTQQQIQNNNEQLIRQRQLQKRRKRVLQERMQAVATQATLYSLVYLNQVLWPITAGIFSSTPNTFFTPNVVTYLIYPLVFIVGYVLYPLQGCINFVVYVRPSIEEWQLVYPDLSLWTILNIMIFYDTSTTTSHGPRSSIRGGQHHPIILARRQRRQLNTISETSTNAAAPPSSSRLPDDIILLSENENISNDEDITMKNEIGEDEQQEEQDTTTANNDIILEEQQQHEEESKEQVSSEAELTQENLQSQELLLLSPPPPERLSDESTSDNSAPVGDKIKDVFPQPPNIENNVMMQRDDKKIHDYKNMTSITTMVSSQQDETNNLQNSTLTSRNDEFTMPNNNNDNTIRRPKSTVMQRSSSKRRSSLMRRQSQSHPQLLYHQRGERHLSGIPYNDNSSRRALLHRQSQSQPYLSSPQRENDNDNNNTTFMFGRRRGRPSSSSRHDSIRSSLKILKNWFGVSSHNRNHRDNNNHIHSSSRHGRNHSRHDPYNDISTSNIRRQGGSSSFRATRSSSFRLSDNVQFQSCPTLGTEEGGNNNVDITVQPSAFIAKDDRELDLEYLF